MLAGKRTSGARGHGFSRFGPQALPFLKALAFHQNKEWFEENRATYEGDLKGPMGELVEDLSAAFAKAKIPLKGSAKSSLFRIHRDVRFSKNKDPYKTNVGAVMNRIGGGKSEPGLFYVHLSVEGCFTAAGFHDPSPEALAKLRGAMARSPKTWKQTLAKLERAGLAPSPEYALKRNPRGFEETTDEAVLAGLRFKSIVVTRPLSDKLIAKPALVGDLVDFAKEALPLLSWGWDALADAR